MSTILPPIRGKKIDNALGKGSVVLITDECLYSMAPHIVNGVPNCIHLTCVESRSAANVRTNMPQSEINELIKEIADELDAKPVTMPMCCRDSDKAWGVAATIFDALAAACRQQISGKT